MSIRKSLYGLLVSANVMALSGCSREAPSTLIAGPRTPAELPTTVPLAAVAHNKGFIWSFESGLQVIPQPSYAQSMYPVAINNHGQVVGHLDLHDGDEQFRAFIWSARDGLQRLGSLAGADGIARALTIDDNGEVRGLSEGPSTTYFIALHLADAFVWTASAGMKPASMPTVGVFKPVWEGGKLVLPAGATCMKLIRATTAGLALGYAGSMAGVSCKTWTALMWKADGTPVVIARCPDWCSTSVSDINNRGEVVGYAGEGAFKWTESAGFVAAPGGNVYLSFINDSGDAVGVLGGEEASKPFVWMSSGEIRAIDLPQGTTSFHLASMNDKAQVIGTFR
jgi:hypothetical protein